MSSLDSISNQISASSAASYASKVAGKAGHTVTYGSDIAAGWSNSDTVDKAKGKASVAGSLYYTASDSGSRSEEDSTYDAVSLPDSDKDFQIEVGAPRKAI